MRTSSQSRHFQAYNRTRSPSPLRKSLPIPSMDESLALGRIPYSSIRISPGTIPPVPSSPDGILKHTSMTQKRRSSIISLSNILPRRKSLQTTVLATRRQSLWMSIAKHPSGNDAIQPLIFPLQQEHSGLRRKKFLRLILVFSYLLSISLFAIALATFYGFFWSGYHTPSTNNVLNVRTSARSPISSRTNSTVVDPDSEETDDFFM